MHTPAPLRQFRYQALDANGTARRGELKAPSKTLALELLHKRGLIPLALDEAIDDSDLWSLLLERLRRSLSGVGQLNASELSSVTHSLSALLKAGLTVDRTLTITRGLELRPAVLLFLDDLAKSIRGGRTFSEALAASGVKLPGYYQSIAQAGEAGGTLPDSLAQISALLKRQLEIRQRIQSALIYPTLLAGIVFVTLVILLVFVLPRFQSLFEESEAKLPLSTQVVLSMGGFIASYWWLLALTVLAAITTAGLLIRRDSWRRRFDRWLVRSRWTFGIPLTLDTGRLMRTLSNLLSSGVPMATALRIARGALGNIYLSDTLEMVNQRIKAGEAFSIALAAPGIFPSQAVQLARVGEETGRLSELLLEAAVILENDGQIALDRLMTLLVPLLTIVMGLVVAGLIGSVLVGLLSLNELAF